MTALSPYTRTRLTLLACFVLGSTVFPVAAAEVQQPGPDQADTEVYPSHPGPALTTATPVRAEPRLLFAPAPNEVVPAMGTKIQTPEPSGSAASPLATAVPKVQPAVAPEAALHPLTLDAAIGLALQHSPDLQIALSQIEKTRGSIDEARAHTKPTVSAQGSANWQSAQSGIPGASSLVGQGAGLTPQVAATLAIPVDVSHQLRWATDLATYQYQSQYLTMVSTAEQLVLSVKSAYFDLLRAVGQGKVAQAAVDNAQAQLTQAKARFDVGAVAAFDVTSAEVNLANLQQQLLIAENQVSLAQTALDRVLGIDVNTPIQIRGVEIAVSGAAVDIPQRTHEAYSRRPEVQIAQLGITAGLTAVDLQKTGLYPALSISAGPTYNFSSNSLSPGLSWQAGINVSVPLYDGGQTRAKVRQAKADVQTSQETLHQTQLTVAQEVRTAALNVMEAAQRSKTTAGAVALAEEALSLAKLRYGSGLAVLVEVTNAETQLTQARNNAVNALYDYAVASAQLQRATSTQPELARLSAPTSPPTTQRQ